MTTKKNMDSLEELKLAESWEYIQGGFLFLDETGEALARANGELKRYINSLSVMEPKAAALISRLKLTDPEQAFEDVPESLKQITEQDISYLKEDPADVDESYGSLAMAAFYGYVSEYLLIPTPVPERMKSYVRTKIHEALPQIRVLG